jgi:hypothetical protein
VITTARTASSAAASSTARGNASASAGLTALSRSGRSSVIVRTPSGVVATCRWA